MFCVGRDSHSLESVCRTGAEGVTDVDETCGDSSGCRPSACTPLTIVVGTGGLGSSLGVGKGKIVVVVVVLYEISKGGHIQIWNLATTYFCANVTCGTEVLDTLVRGVGRIGAPAPIIHDFCRAPPTSVLNVAFELSTSRSVTAFPSLSGGRRISQ